MHRHLQKLLLVALIASFCGQAQGSLFYVDSPQEVQQRIAAGADVNERNSNNVTPLHGAALGKQHLVVKALIYAGANVNARDNSGNTPLHLASAHRHNPYVIQALINAGADVNAQNLAGDTPLHFAVLSIPLRGSVEINDLNLVRLLVSNAGANKDFTNASGNTAAAIALQESNNPISTRLHERYHNIHTLLTDPANAPTMSLDVELCRAISSNNPAILKATLDRLAFPINNPINTHGTSLLYYHAAGRFKGNTLLHYAAWRGFVGQALLLISYGADPEQTNTAGVRAIDMGTAIFRRTLATGTERSHLALTALERPGSTHTSVLPRAITEQIFSFAGDLNPLPETLIAGISGLEIDNVMALRPGSRVAAVLDEHKRAAAKSERRAQAEERAEAAARRQHLRLADGSAEASPRHADGCTGANGCPGCGHE